MSKAKYQPLQDLQNTEHVHPAHGKCVCQTCNCGKHKCPQPIKHGDFHSSYNQDYPKYDNYHPEGKYKMIQKNFIMPEDKFTGQSVYTEEYIKKGAGRPADKFVPKGQIQLSKDPFSAHSSYLDDYLNRGQGQRAEKVQLPKNMVIPQGKFDGNTNYHQNYIGGSSEKTTQFRPIGELKTGGNFQGTSSYVADYQNKGVGARAERAPLPKNQIMPQGKFQSTTDYTQNFIPGKIQKSQQFKPEGQLKVGGNFQGTSSYQSDYAAKGMGQRAQKYPLPHNQVMPDGKFQGNSAYTESYIPGKIQKQRQFKPEGQLKIGGQFKGQSSYITDFANKGSGSKAQKVPLPKNQILPQGRFEGDSIYTSNYVPNRAERQPQFKPQGQLKLGGDFQGSSSYGQDYDYKGMGQRSERAPLPKNQVMPQGRFEGNTAYHADYMGGKGEKNLQFKPIGELKVGDGKFDGSTVYNNDYENKGRPVRAERAALPHNQVMPQGKFQGNTAYTSDYVPSQIQKSPQYRPTQQLKVGGKFQGNPTYSSDYVANSQIQRNQQFRPTPQLKVGGKFEGGTTYEKTYTAPPQIKREHCLCDELEAPRHRVASKQHVRYNHTTGKWQ